jgi:Ca-activated chloride channel family protein
MTFLYAKSYYLIFILLGFLAGAYFVWLIFRVWREGESSPFSRLRNYESSRVQTLVRYACLALAFLFLTVSLLRPQWGVKTQVSEASGIDVVFALDVSKSMQALDLSQDGGQLDRLTVSKSMIADFASQNPGNRYGLVVFAGEAFVSTPLTFDNAAFLTFLEGVSNADVGKQGTELGEALKASLDRFVSKDEAARGKAIILISDGGEEGETDYRELAKVAKEDGIAIYAVGIGSDEGVPIPESRDLFGRVNYKTFQGETVLTKLNDEPLKDIADMTGGKYYQADEGKDMVAIAKELEDLPKTTLSSETKSGAEDRYQIFLLPAFLFFIFFIMLPERRIWPFPLALVFLLSGCQSDLAFRYHNQKGNEANALGYYAEAIGKYDQARESSTALAYLADNNSAIAEYAEKDFSSALSRLQVLADGACKDKSRDYCDQVYYNLGNAYYRVGEIEVDKGKQKELWEKAIKAYEQDLEINKDDTAAKENIEFIKSKLAEAAKQEQADSQKKDGQSGSESEKSGEQSGQKGEGEKSGKEGAEKSDQAGQSGEEKGEQAGEKKDGEQAGEGQDKNGEQGQGQAASQSDELDEQTAAEAERYMQNMTQNERELQRFFRQNKNEQEQSQQDSFGIFNDPFFQNMMGGQLSDKTADPNEQDW